MKAAGIILLTTKIVL